MNEAIWKYHISIGINNIGMPKDANILCVQIQNGKPCIWARVNLDNEIEKRSFAVFGTGISMSNLGFMKIYIGTFQEGEFVGHLFELIEK